MYVINDEGRMVIKLAAGDDRWEGLYIRFMAFSGGHLCICF